MYNAEKKNIYHTYMTGADILLSFNLNKEYK